MFERTIYNGMVAIKSNNNTLFQGATSLTTSNGSSGRVFGAVAFGEYTTLTVSALSKISNVTFIFYKKDGTSERLVLSAGNTNVSNYVCAAFYYDTASASATFTLS